MWQRNMGNSNRRCAGYTVLALGLLLGFDTARAQNLGQISGSFFPDHFQNSNGVITDSVTASTGQTSSQTSYKAGMFLQHDGGAALVAQVNAQLSFSSASFPANIYGYCWFSEPLLITPTDSSLNGSFLRVTPVFEIQGTSNFVSKSAMFGGIDAQYFVNAGLFGYTQGGPSFDSTIISPLSETGFFGQTFTLADQITWQIVTPLPLTTGINSFSATLYINGLDVSTESNGIDTPLNPSQYHITLADPTLPFNGAALDLGIAAVPEPGGLFILVGAATLLRRKRASTMQ